MTSFMSPIDGSFGGGDFKASLASARLITTESLRTIPTNVLSPGVKVPNLNGLDVWAEKFVVTDTIASAVSSGANRSMRSLRPRRIIQFAVQSADRRAW